MKLKEIPRTATFAWSPAAERPLIATGTAAGAIDADFSAATALELWPLDFTDHTVAAFAKEDPAARVETDARFHDLAFNNTGEIVVGALESGVVEAWSIANDAGKYSVKSVARAEQPSQGPVKSAAFSSLNKKLATGGSGGQVYVWDLASGLSKPESPGGASRHGDVSCVAWNNHSAQILAASGSNGFTSIYDTARKREVLHLHYNSRASGSPVPVSTVAWHPRDSTRLITASVDDNEPVILLWNLRNVHVPEKILQQGHSKGVLSVDWCHQDPGLLLSGGRDNATLLWNPEKGGLLGSYPISVEWAFKTAFHPTMPDLFATASFDGKVTVQTLQDTKGGVANTASENTNDAGDDFWNSNTVMDAVHPGFVLDQAPAWLRRPISAKFGFGGKLAVARAEKVTISQVKDDSLGSEQKEFSKQLQSGDLAAIAEAREATGTDWKVLADFVADKDVTERLPEAKEIDVKAKLPDSGAEAESVPSGKFAIDDDVTRVILRGDFDSAVAMLLDAGKPSDALIVATFAPESDRDKLVKISRAASIKSHPSPALRAALAVSSKDLLDLAENCDLKEWFTVLRSMLTLDPSNKRKLARVLGNRLSSAGRRDDAVLTFLLGGSIAGAGHLWLSELPDLEKKLVKGGDVTAYEAHVRALQTVVEKITVAVKTTKSTVGEEESDVDGVYRVLCDYANIAASQGDLSLARVYLDMLPEKYSQEKDRIHKATAVTVPSSNTAAAASNGRRRPQTHNVYAQHKPATPPAPVAATGYAAGSPYNPAAPVTAGIPAPAPTVQSAPPVLAAQAPPTAAKTAPRQVSSGGWNDLPDIGVPQRRTPVAPQIIAPNYPSSAPPVRPASSSSLKNTQPPPTKSSNMSGPNGNGSLSKNKPPIDPPTSGPGAAASAGPYGVPPTPNSGLYGAPLSTPMGPTPISQAPSVPPATLSNPYGPKSTVRSTVSSNANPYAPPASTASPVPGPRSTPPSKVGPTPAKTASVPPPAGPARFTGPPRAAARASPLATSTPLPGATSAPAAPGPAPVSVPGAPVPAIPTASTAAATAAATEAEAAAAAAAAAAVAAEQTQTQPPKFPKGDRSHIPASDLVIYQVLQQECDRVKPFVEARYSKQHLDTQRRLNILFDHLNNQDLLEENTLADMRRLAESISTADFASAEAIVTDILAGRSVQGGDWMVGVRRLIQMGKAVLPSA